MTKEFCKSLLHSTLTIPRYPLFTEMKRQKRTKIIICQCKWNSSNKVTVNIIPKFPNNIAWPAYSTKLACLDLSISSNGTIANNLILCVSPFLM